MSIIAFLVGFPRRAATSIGASLSARGGESVMYASVASQAAGVTKGAELTPIAGAVTFVMSSLCPFFLKKSYAMADRVSRSAPHFVRYGSALILADPRKAGNSQVAQALQGPKEICDFFGLIPGLHLGDNSDQRRGPSDRLCRRCGGDRDDMVCGPVRAPTFRTSDRLLQHGHTTREPCVHQSIYRLVRMPGPAHVYICRFPLHHILAIHVHNHSCLLPVVALPDEVGAFQDMRRVQVRKGEEGGRTGPFAGRTPSADGDPPIQLSA